MLFVNRWAGGSSLSQNVHMFNKETVFILGTGASEPYDFPLGIVVWR